MDTRKSDSKELSLIEIVDLVWTSAEEIGEELKHKIDRVSKQCKEELHRALLPPPTLPIPATQEQCRQVAEELHSRYEKKMEELKVSRDSLQKSLNRQISLLERVDLMSKQFSRKVRKHAEKSKFTVYRERSMEELRFFVSAASCDPLDSELLQVSLQKMMKGQDEELKEWFFKEILSRCGSHVTRFSMPCPAVNLASTRKPPTLNLSPEIMTRVYSYCELESCVALREVSTEWYHRYKEIESLLREKMRERNPFILPGDADFKSYADCVLVFVTRLKWPSVNSLSDIEVSGDLAEYKKVVAFDLELNEKLPYDFKGMMPLESGCTVACDHFFAVAAWQSQEFIRNLWDLSSKPKDEPWELLIADEQATVIKYKETLVTLPPEIKPEHIVPFTGLNTPVHLGTMIVTVELLDGRMISVPREDSLYRRGFIFHAPGARLYQIGNVHFARESPGLIHKNTVYRYKFADFDSRQMIEYGAGRHMYPVAAYNGCVWWHLLATPNSLVPTFIDLKNPDKVYFQPRRAVSGVSPNLFEQSFRNMSTSQFAVSLSDCGIQVVDLDRRVVTEVTGPNEKPAARFFPGYWNDAFMVRCMNEEVVQATTELVLQEQGVPEEEWRV